MLGHQGTGAWFSRVAVTMAGWESTTRLLLKTRFRTDPTTKMSSPNKTSLPAADYWCADVKSSGHWLLVLLCGGGRGFGTYLRSILGMGLEPNNFLKEYALLGRFSPKSSLVRHEYIIKKEAHGCC